MPAKSTSKTRLTKEARREQILEAALTAFERGGYHGTHVDAIVEEAGVARGTFYLHFPGKHEVFEALVDRMLGIFLDVKPTSPEPPIRSPADAEAVLRASYRTVFETFRTHRRLCRLLFEEAVGLDKGFSKRLAKHFLAWHGRVRATLDLFASPTARAAIPGLLMEMRSDPTLRERFSARIEQEARRRFAGDVVGPAVDAGEARPGIDADTLFDAIIGAVLFAVCVRDIDDLDVFAATLTDLLRQGFEAR